MKVDNSMFYIGQIVKTNYGTGPYVIDEITISDDPAFLDSLNNGGKAKRIPHFSLVCHKFLENPKHKYYLNGYDEIGNSIWGFEDRVIDIRSEITLNIISYGL